MQDFNLNFNLDDLTEEQNVKEEEVEKVEQPIEKEHEYKATPTPTPTTTAPAKKNSGDYNVVLAQRAIDKITEMASLSNQVVTETEKQIATDIILTTNKAVVSSGYNWNQIDVVNNNFFGEIKRWARLGVDATTDHLYPDIRKNSKTGKVDIKIKGQYQTIRKLITKFCSKKIFNFKDDVICKSDTFIKKFDFATGTERVEDHIYGENRNPNALDDIIGAYVVAFVEEKNGRITQLVTYIDKNRINRAYNAAQTKNVWNNDTRKMVIKTAYWEMWNSPSIQPFMVFPDDIREDLTVVNETSDVEFDNKDFKHNSIDAAEDTAKSRFGSGEVLDF